MDKSNEGCQIIKQTMDRSKESCRNIKQHIDMAKIDFLVQLAPKKSIIAGLTAVPPLQAICYYTALARDLNPDKQMFEAIDFLE